jgi:surface polysaccharide O-acyltransferase-like enzyme
MSVAVTNFKSATGEAVTPANAVASYDISLGYLRAFVTVLVVMHHAFVGYIGVPLSHRFAGGQMFWRLAPVSDTLHMFPLAGAIVGLNDAYFMALMFLLSGLFVDQSIAKKGVWGFVRDRALRLGIPFIFSAIIVSQGAYYFAYLQSGGTPGFMNYLAAWPGIGYLQTGPAWFVSLLLAFDIAIAVLYLAVPHIGRWIGSLGSKANERPGRFFLLFLVLSLVAYAPLAHAFGALDWTYWVFFQFQTSRVLNYFLYFMVGVGIGACGLRNGLLSPTGMLARRWWVWMLVLTPIALILGTAVFVAIFATKGAVRGVLMDVGSLTFVFLCASASFGWLAVFTRFVKRGNPVMDSLRRNAYGIYLVHYFFVVLLQYILLSVAFPGFGKAAMVTAGALALSWALASALRHTPVVSRLVGE